MGDIIERIEKLIALSTSENENEARNAAWIAVKLIREHDLTVRTPPPVRQPMAFEDLFRDWTPPPRRPPPPRKGQGSRQQPPPPEPAAPPPEEPGRYVSDLSEEEIAELLK